MFVEFLQFVFVDDPILQGILALDYLEMDYTFIFKDFMRFCSKKTWIEKTKREKSNTKNENQKEERRLERRRKEKKRKE